MAYISLPAAAPGVLLLAHNCVIFKMDKVSSYQNQSFFVGVYLLLLLLRFGSIAGCVQMCSLVYELLMRCCGLHG